MLEDIVTWVGTSKRCLDRRHDHFTAVYDGGPPSFEQLMLRCTILPGDLSDPLSPGSYTSSAYSTRWVEPG